MNSHTDTPAKPSKRELDRRLCDCNVWREGDIVATYTFSIPRDVDNVHDFLHGRIMAREGDIVELRFPGSDACAMNGRTTETS